MTPVLSVEALHKRFGGVLAVQGVDLAVAPGELLGLFGPNGAGKTTLFNLIAGTFAPDRGRVALNGIDVTGLSAFRRARAGIARTFQVCRPFRSMTVAENVNVALTGSILRGRNERAHILGILDAVGLVSRADDAAATLTLGMLKRLEVARALALEPKLFLLDEPLAGLSGGETGELLDCIRGLKERAAIIFVDHNVRQSLKICDRAIVMDRGEVIATGTPDDIRRDVRVRVAYLGEDGA